MLIMAEDLVNENEIYFFFLNGLVYVESKKWPIRELLG